MAMKLEKTVNSLFYCYSGVVSQHGRRRKFATYFFFLNFQSLVLNILFKCPEGSEENLNPLAFFSDSGL